jgi:hypothetical protein
MRTAKAMAVMPAIAAITCARVLSDSDTREAVDA